jgi:phage terminase Nu1 subunit (DNA packaging protein)
MLVNQKTICAALRKTATTIKAWQERAEDPLPVQRSGKRGVGHRYDIGACCEWHERQIAKNAETPPNERELLARAQRIKIEIETDVLRGELIPRKVVVTEYGRLVVAFSTRMQSIPTKAAAVLVAMSEPEIQAALDDYIRDALAELSVGRAGGTGEAAAEANRKSVGRRRKGAVEGVGGRTGPVEH